MTYHLLRVAVPLLDALHGVTHLARHVARAQLQRRQQRRAEAAWQALRLELLRDVAVER